jgi:hypothetical protein
VKDIILHIIDQSAAIFTAVGVVLAALYARDARSQASASLESSRQNSIKLEDTHKLVNSRMTESQELLAKLLAFQRELEKFRVVDPEIAAKAAADVLKTAETAAVVLVEAKKN